MTWKAAGLFIIPIAASLVARFLLRGRVSEEVEFGVSMFVLMLALYPFNRYLTQGRTAEGERRRPARHNFMAHVVASVVGAAVGTLGLLLLKVVGWY